MKKLILGALTIALIACSSDDINNGSGNGYGTDNAWVGDLEIASTKFLEDYNFCGNAKANIKRDLIASTVIGIFTGTLSWRNSLNNGLGIAFNRGVIQNCKNIGKVMLSLYSYQPYLPEGDSVLFIEPVAITSWNYYSSNGWANDYKKIDYFIQAGKLPGGGKESALYLKKSGNLTTGKVSSYKWYQKADSNSSAKRDNINKKLEIKTWRVNDQSTYNKDIHIEIRKDGNLIGDSVLTFAGNNSNYSKIRPKIKRQVASFIENLKNQHLLQGIVSGLILLIITALFLLPKKEH